MIAPRRDDRPLTAATADLLALPSPPAWVDLALCAEVGGDLHYPERGESEGRDAAAKRVCGLCSVQPACLSYALENDERYGVWGGLSANQRRRLKKRAAS